jgi:hypothetical protein
MATNCSNEIIKLLWNPKQMEMDKDGQLCRSISDSSGRAWARKGTLLLVTSTMRIYNGMGVHLRRLRWFPNVFRSRLYICCHPVESTKKRKSNDGRCEC